jgi:hypothetical protein
MNFTKAMAVISAFSLIAASGCSSTANKSTKNQDTKTLAEELSDNLDSGMYSLDMTISGTDYTTEMPCKICEADGDGYVYMEISGIPTEFYTVDSQTYMLFSDIKCYQITEDSGSFGNVLFKIGEGDTLTSTDTADGKTTEVYTSTSDSSDEKSTYPFVFDEETGTLESFKSVSGDTTTEISVSSVSWDNVKIEMPDLSDWADISDTDSLDETTQNKFALYCMGVTEDIMQEKGYSYDDFDKLTDDDIQALIDDMGLLSSGDDSSDSDSDTDSDTDTDTESAE